MGLCDRSKLGLSDTCGSVEVQSMVHVAQRCLVEVGEYRHHGGVGRHIEETQTDRHSPYQLLSFRWVGKYETVKRVGKRYLYALYQSISAYRAACVKIRPLPIQLAPACVGVASTAGDLV